MSIESIPVFKAFWNKWCRRSVTMAWGYLKVLVGAILLSFHEIVQVVGEVVVDPDVKAAINALNFPAYVGLGLAVIGAITLIARAHSFHFSETPDVVS